MGDELKDEVAVDPQALAQFQDFKRQTDARTLLRQQNAPLQVDALRQQISSGAMKLKSDIKKSSAFVKKLKMLSENNVDALAKDVVELNLTRYISECVAAIADAPFKMADLHAAIKIISLLHQRYVEFTPSMVTALLTAFDASYGTEDKSKIIKRRIILRLLSELVLVGVFEDVHAILSIIQRVVRREGASNKSKSKGNMSVASSSSSSSAQLEVPLLVGFAKAVGLEYLGVQPKKFKALEVHLGTEFTSVMEQATTVVPAAIQRELVACFSEAYDMICKFYLAQHTALLKLERRNEKEEMNRGEVSEQHAQELENAKLLFEKLNASVNSLADALDKEVPPLPSDKRDDENGGGLLLWEADGSGRSQQQSDSPFDDEDTRSFYEDLPDLLELVPAVVLGLSEAEVAELKKKKAAAPTTEEEASEAELEVENEADGDNEADENEDTEEPADDEEGKTGEKTDDGATSATNASTTTGYHHQHDQFFNSLDDLVNRERCDKAAVEFCYRNSKANRNRLVRTLFNVPRTHLELLAYYARLVATLQSVLKDDIGTELVNLLVDEFNHLIRKRNQFRLESKIKNIRFLAELVKFRICPPNVGFRCLKRCFTDFQGHNVHVATTFLENCGRFLYCSKHTHVRTENFLIIMMKLKSAKHLDPQAETLVQNAYYMCKPPERVERAAKQYDPLYLFTIKLLYENLDETNVGKIIKTLRKLPWNDPSTYDLMLRALKKVTKGKVMHMKLVCEVVKGLSRYHDAIAILLIDDVLEFTRRGLEMNDYRDQQRRLGYVKLLAELYNVGLINVNVVLETLYLIIHHSHDLLQLPQYTVGPQCTAGQLDQIKKRFALVPDMRYDPRVPSDVDGPTDVFRIRLACVLIEGVSSSVERGISKTRLARFMVFFQRYILSKTDLPLETDFVVLDLMEALTVSLKDQFTKLETWEEADAAVQEILRLEYEEALRKQQKKGGMVVTTRDSLEVGEEEDEEEDDEPSDDEEEDDGEDEDDDDDADDDDDDDEEEDDDDDDDDDDEEEEEEEEEEQLIIRDRIQRTEDDDVFEKAFKSMIQSSMESRKLVGRVNVDKMVIPTVVKNVKDESETTDDGANRQDGVVFRMLRRGNKGKVEARQLIVPEGSSLAQHSHRQEDVGKKQQSELKRLVLQNMERDDFFTSSSTDVDPTFTTSTRPKEPEQKAQYGANSEWNNAEFGLRRGRNYRGSK